jgi:hypothetical protein
MPLEALSRFLSQPPTPRRATALRIALGLVAVIAYLPILPAFLTIFGESGFAPGANLFPWKLRDSVQTMVVISLFLGALGMIAGASPRVATAVVWFAHSWLWLSNSSYYWSWGLLFSDFLFFLVFFVSAAQSATGRSWAGFWFRMFQVQVCFVYLLSCVYRYDSRAWLRGEAFHIAMADTVFGRFTFLNWYSYYRFTAPLTYAAWAVEWMAGLFLLFHKTLGPYLVLALIGLHASLELTTMVQSWQFLMVASLVAFWPESWLAGVGAHARRLASRTTRERPARG